MTRHIRENITALLAPEQEWHLELLTNWNNIMGTLSDKVRLEKIQGNTLILGVFDSSWMQELFLLSRVLIQTINKQLSQPYVKELKFKAAAHKKATAKNTYQPQSSIKKTKKPERALSQQELQALEKIADEQLRSVLREYLIHCEGNDEENNIVDVRTNNSLVRKSRS